MRVALATLLVVAGVARAEPPPSIHARGTCTASALPDRARLAAWAEHDAADPAHAAAAATTAYNRFEHDVQALHLPDAVLQSSGVTTERLTEDDTGKPAPIRYRATAGLQIESSSPAAMAAVMQTAATDGIDNVTGLDVFVSDAERDRLTADCLPRAAADARAKAAALLRGLGDTLGAVLRVDGFEASGAERPPMPPGAGSPLRMAMATPAPTLATGPQTLTISTDITFAIESAPSASK